MAIKQHEWKETLVQLFALASNLEGEGQYNLAKLTRAAADSLNRQAAYALEIPTAKEKLSSAVKDISDVLTNFDVSSDLVTALKQGADIMAEGQLPLIDVAPHPYVCRTCGHLVLNEPAEKCPRCNAWPSTYQRFLPVYWLDALEPLAAMERLRQTPLEVEKLLEGLSEADMKQQPKDGGWAIRNVLSHLRDAQGVLSFRVDLFLKEKHPTLESKAVFSWATNEDDRRPSALEIYKTYKTSREETISKLENLPLENWWHTGQHQEFGTVTLRQQVSYFASHEITHFPQIESIKRQLKITE